MAPPKLLAETTKCTPPTIQSAILEIFVLFLREVYMKVRAFNPENREASDYISLLYSQVTHSEWFCQNKNSVLDVYCVNNPCKLGADCGSREWIRAGYRLVGPQQEKFQTHTLTEEVRAV